MAFFKRKEEGVAAASTQLRSRDALPWNGLMDMAPLGGGEARLYQAIRQGVPAVDAALCKIIRLAGGVWVACETQDVQRQMDRFL